MAKFHCVGLLLALALYSAPAVKGDSSTYSYNIGSLRISFLGAAQRAQLLKTATPKLGLKLTEIDVAIDVQAKEDNYKDVIHLFAGQSKEIACLVEFAVFKGVLQGGHKDCVNKAQVQNFAEEVTKTVSKLFARISAITNMIRKGAHEIAKIFENGVKRKFYTKM